MLNAKPKIIYKYRDWNNFNHKKTLIDFELFLSSPKDFNDPFDCRITQNFELLDTDEKIWEFARNQSQRFRASFEKSGASVSDFERRVYDRLKNHRKEEQKDWDDYTFRKNDEHYGVISFSEIWDSILMWGHYACNHSGFCIGFFEERLRESGHFGGGGAVTYTDNFPNVNPLESVSIRSLFIQTHTKATDWKYEREYRLVKLFHPKEATIEDRKIYLNTSCYAELLIGVKFPKDQIKVISDIACQLGVKLYQVKQIPFQFKLTRERID